jgi:hypothetical protein
MEKIAAEFRIQWKIIVTGNSMGKKNFPARTGSTVPQLQF